MVALALTGNGSISDAESTTGWVGDTFSLEPDIKVEGSNSIACTQTNNGTNDIYFSGSWNLSGTHIRLFWNVSYVGNFSATNPVQVFLSDGTNTDYVTYFSSNTDYAGGWVDLLVDTALFTTVTLTSVTQVGVRVSTATKPRNVPANAWFDNWRYSNGMEIYSSTTEAVSFQNAASTDAANVYGILNDVDGVLFAAGELVLGRTGSDNANIVSSNETIVFPDRLVTSSVYKIKTQEGTGNTDIDISGLVCKTVGGTGAELDISSTLNSLVFTGNTFISSGAITLTPTVTTPTFANNTFVSCGTTSLGIEATGCTWDNSALVTITGSGKLTGCTISNSSSSSFVDVPSIDDLSGCTFIGDGTTTPGHAVDLGTVSGGTAPAPVSLVWDNTLDNGTTNQSVWEGATQGQTAGTQGTANSAITIDVPSGSFVKISVASGATIPTVQNTGTGTLEISANEVTLTITVVDNDTKLAIEGAIVYVTNTAGTTTYIDKVETNSSGQVTDTRSLGSASSLAGRIRAATPASKPYTKYYKTSDVIGTYSNTQDTDITVALIPDQ